VDLQKALLERSARIPPKHTQALDTSPDPELQHHELVSQLPLQYCSVCTDPPVKKQKQVVLGEISDNSKSKDVQKRQKTRFGCLKYGVATCKDNGCFIKHCNTTNIS
jgi:hypothetical protein